MGLLEKLKHCAKVSYIPFNQVPDGAKFRFKGQYMHTRGTKKGAGYFFDGHYNRQVNMTELCFDLSKN